MFLITVLFFFCVLLEQIFIQFFLKLYLADQLVFPCELTDLYAPDIQTVPTMFRFDYMIKSRYLDLIMSCGNVVIKPGDLINAIQHVWFFKNNYATNITQIDVKLGESIFYTSTFQE